MITVHTFASLSDLSTLRQALTAKGFSLASYVTACRAAGPQDSGTSGKQDSRTAGQRDSRKAGQQESGQHDSGTAGERDSRKQEIRTVRQTAGQRDSRTA